jgi:hypothetical protein
VKLKKLVNHHNPLSPIRIVEAQSPLTNTGFNAVAISRVAITGPHEHTQLEPSVVTGPTTRDASPNRIAIHPRPRLSRLSHYRFGHSSKRDCFGPSLNSAWHRFNSTTQRHRASVPVGNNQIPQHFFSPVPSPAISFISL